MTSPQDLKKAEARYQRAARRAEEAREERNRLICEAIHAGWPHARIAEATGLTRARVGQIALTCRERVQGDAASPEEPGIYVCRCGWQGSFADAGRHVDGCPSWADELWQQAYERGQLG